MLLDHEGEAIERQAGLRDLAKEAIAIRESGDRGGARRFLSSEGERLELRLILIEQGESDARLPSFIHNRMKSSWYPQKPAVIDVGDDYRLVAWPRAHGAGWLNPRFFRAIELGLAFLMPGRRYWGTRGCCIERLTTFCRMHWIIRRRVKLFTWA